MISDISQLFRARKLIEASESVSKILSDSHTVSAAAKAIINMLKTYLDWEVVVVWIWDKDRLVLSCIDIAHIDEINIDEFANKTKNLELESRLSSNPTKVWSTYRPVWHEDITEDPSFLRRDEAIKAGLRGSVAFPVFKETQLIGVIELFRRTSFKDKVDDQWLNLITSIGIELGLFIQRLTEEEAIVQMPIILNHTNDAVITVDKLGKVKSWNKAAEKIFGWTSQEMVGQDIIKIFPSDKEHEYKDIREALLSGKSIDKFKTQRVNKKGEKIWVINGYGLLKDPFGDFSAVCVIMHDISANISYEKNMNLNKERFKDFIRMTEEWIWEIDILGNFTFSNSAVYKILGNTIEEVLGKNFLSFINKESKKRIESQLKENSALKKGWIHEIIHFIHKNDSELWLETNSAPLLDEKGKILGFRGTSRDITESKNLEQVKNEFISIVSHELKNPLASIYGALSLIQGRPLKPEQKEQLILTAQRNSELLTNIINDITDVERLQLGKLKFEFQKINLLDVIKDSIDTSQLIADKKEVKIVTEILCPDAIILGDYQRILQVMINLLSNAIKFSPDKETVLVKIECAKNNFKVSVQDKGAGIPKEFQPKVFEKFAQADSSIKRIYRGTGLGLYICKSIIEALGGHIDFMTETGIGTTFFFELPKYNEGEIL